MSGVLPVKQKGRCGAARVDRAVTGRVNSNIMELTIGDYVQLLSDYRNLTQAPVP